MMRYYGYNMGDFGFLGVLLMVVFWTLVIWAVVALVRYLAGGEHYRSVHGRMGCCGHDKMPDHESKMPGLPDNHAMEILKERYAKGDISKEEFETKKKDLMA